MPVYLYLISQEERSGYDTYSNAVVTAASPEAARNIHPSHFCAPFSSEEGPKDWERSHAWARSPDKVNVQLLGEAHVDIPNNVVIVYSFHAG